MLNKIFIYNDYNPVTKRITGVAKEPIILALTSPGPDYTEQTTVKQISDVLDILLVDNLFRQDKIREAFELTTWGALTNEENDILIAASVGDNDAEKVPYLMSQGKTYFEAVDVLRNAWVDNYEPNKKACVSRLNSRTMSNVLAKYLSMADAEDLETTLGTLIASYERGKRGLMHQGETYGLLDYFNSTPLSPYELNGLKENKTYAMQNGDANLDNFIADALSVLRYGNYEL